MEPKKPRWVDKPELDWTPETPLRFGPETSALPHAIAWPGAPKQKPANQNTAQPGFVPRLAIGFGQGVALAALFNLQDHSLSADSNLLAAHIMALTFAPFLLVQGLGRIPMRTLLIWTSFAAFGLAGLGVYHHWRIAGADADHSGLWLAGLVAAFLFIGQSLLLGDARSGPGPVRYAVLYESSWRLAIEVTLCGLFALLAWGLWTVCTGWLHMSTPLSSLACTIPVVTLSLAVAAQWRAGPMLHLLKRVSVIGFTAILPLAILLATGTILFGSLSRWRPPLALCAAACVLLLIAINASYRGGGEWRPHWRRWLEFTGANLLLPLAVLAGLALQMRVAQFGFTAPRVIAMACVLLLSAYGLTYAGAAVISLSGGLWMQRLEGANLLMAFVGLSLIATLASPLGDPVRLAVASQNWRLMHGRVAPEAFDYAYLRKSGLRFGQTVLATMAHPRASRPKP